MHFHTSGLDSLYEHVPKYILPSDYGGEDKPSSELAGLYMIKKPKILFEILIF